MDADSTGRGTAVARAARMARRITAVVAMVILLGLLLILLWQVYLHHQRSALSNEPSVVLLRMVEPVANGA